MRIKTVKLEGESRVVHLKLKDENLIIEGDDIKILVNTKSGMLGKNLNIYPRSKRLKTRIVFKEDDWAHPQKKSLDLNEIDGIQFCWRK